MDASALADYFMQNKANLLKDKINAIFFATKDYENKPRRRLQENKPNQTQFQSPAKPPKEHQEKNRSGHLLINRKEASLQNSQWSVWYPAYRPM